MCDGKTLIGLQTAAACRFSVDPGRAAGGNARHHGTAGDGSAPASSRTVLRLRINPVHMSYDSGWPYPIQQLGLVLTTE
jgi:hypothetical protein